jgi:hypothetical protein
MMVGEIDGYNLIVSRFYDRGRSQWLSKVDAFLDGWLGGGLKYLFPNRDRGSKFKRVWRVNLAKHKIFRTAEMRILNKWCKFNEL